MKYILPRRPFARFFNQKLRVNEENGSSYNLQITSEDSDTFLNVDKQLTTRGKKYLIRLGILAPYEYVSYNIASTICNLESAFAKFTNFRVIIDRSKDVGLIPFYNYEGLRYDESDNIPENAFATVYSTVTYTKFEYRNNEPGDNLHYSYENNCYKYFNGYVQPKNDLKVVWMNENFIKLNPHCGYYNINGIRVYILTNHVIFGNISSIDDLKFNDLKIVNIDKSTLNSILGIFTKYNIQPNISENSINGSDINNLMFIGKINNTPFDKYL